MTTVTFTGTSDCYFGNTEPDVNYTENVLYAGEFDGVSAIARTLLKFTITGISGTSQINSAKLRLYVEGDDAANDRQLSIYRVKRNWVESEATWNEYSDGNSWSTAGATNANDIDTTPLGSLTLVNGETGYKEWTLSATEIKKMIDGTYSNYGFLVKADTESNDAYTFTSYRGTSSQRPKLDIDYTNIEWRHLAVGIF